MVKNKDNSTGFTYKKKGDESGENFKKTFEMAED